MRPTVREVGSSWPIVCQPLLPPSCCTNIFSSMSLTMVTMATNGFANKSCWNLERKISVPVATILQPFWNGGPIRRRCPWVCLLLVLMENPGTVELNPSQWLKILQQPFWIPEVLEKVNWMDGAFHWKMEKRVLTWMEETMYWMPLQKWRCLLPSPRTMVAIPSWSPLTIPRVNYLSL